MSKQFKVKYTRSSNNPDFKVTTPYIYYSLFYACYFEYNIPPPTFNDTINDLTASFFTLNIKIIRKKFKNAI